MRNICPICSSPTLWSFVPQCIINKRRQQPFLGSGRWHWAMKVTPYLHQLPSELCVPYSVEVWTDSTIFIDPFQPTFDLDQEGLYPQAAPFAPSHFGTQRQCRAVQCCWAQPSLNAHFLTPPKIWITNATAQPCCQWGDRSLAPELGSNCSWATCGWRGMSAES